MAERPERMARFQREAKLLAALDHSHIAAIHGLHEEEGQHFLVMELVDGETLADRLRRGPFAVPEALEVGREIAEALERTSIASKGTLWQSRECLAAGRGE